MRYDFMLTIPLINEQGEPVGRMSKFIQRRPKYIPRIGEHVYVLPSMTLEVEKVSYDGLSLHMVHIYLKPLSSEFRGALETSLGNRKNSNWRWSEK